MVSTWQGFKQRPLCSELLGRPNIKTLVEHRSFINVWQQCRVSIKYANAIASYQVQLVQRRCTNETEGFSITKKLVHIFLQKLLICVT
jgi:hypothetical protein